MKTFSHNSSSNFKHSIIATIFLLYVFQNAISQVNPVGANGGIVPMSVCPGSYLSPSELYPGASGGVYTVNLISDCPTYTVAESLSWVSYTKSGKTVTLTISANSGSERSGIVSIGQLPLNIYQACGNYPGSAGSITGTNAVCPGTSNVSYSVSPISNATGYSWALPSGASIVSGANTNSISVNYSTSAVSGNITVRGTGCGSGSTSPNYYVTVYSISEPGSISGDNFPCSGSTHTYSISAVSGATYYTWSLPPGASGASSSNSINITFGTQTGYITVRAHNSLCSSSTSTNLLVGIPSLVQYNVSGGATICQGATAQVILASSYASASYNLYLNGSLLSSENKPGTGYGLTWYESSAGTYTVKGVTQEGCEFPMIGSATIILRTPSTPATSIIANPSAICPGGSSTLTLNGGSLEPGYGVWKWYSGTCGSILVGTGPSITVSPSVTTTYFVRAEGGCTPFTSCVSKTVVINEPPVIAGQPVDATITLDQSASFLVSATGTNLQYQWQYSSAPNGPWTSLVGKTTNNLMVDNSEIFKTRFYRCQLTSDCGTLNTNSAKIIVVVDYLGESELPDPNRPIDVSKEVGTTNISASVNPVGAATINIPIFSSPGTNGMTPSVSINYNSQTGNDVLGYGWHIGGLSSVIRTGKVLYYDNEASAVTFTTSDKFILGGERIMLSDGTYGAANSVYFSESNPFSKITAYGTTGNGPTYFKQETKDGITYEYGNSTDSRHFAGNVGSTVYAWLINKAVDNNGNYIKYNYSNSEGEYWLRSIVYTGNTQQSLDPYDSLVFNYTVRTDDKSFFYVGPGYVLKTKLLQNIIVYCEGNQVRKYEFGYTNGFYSQLVEISEYDKNGHKYNPIVIDWGNEGTYHSTSEPYIDRFETNEGVMTGDFNGDGIEEVAYWGGFESGSYLSVYKIGKNNFQGIYSKTFDPDFFSTYPKQFSSCSNGDMDGDGTDDLIFTSTDSLFIYYGDQSEQQMFSRHSSQSYNGHSGYSTGDFNGDGIGELEAMNTNKKLINFDGDSRTDKIVFSASGYELITSTSSSGTITSSILNSGNVSKVFEGDFNGDFQTDLLVKTAAGWVIMDYNGSQYNSNSAYTVPLSGSFDPTAAGNVLFVRDLNNDGKSDIIKITGGNQHIWNCYLSKGLNFKSEQYIFSATKPPAYGDFIFGDFNGEGQLNCFYDLKDLIELKRDDRINLVESALNGLNHAYTFNYGYNVTPSTEFSRPELNTLIYETFSGFVVNSLTHHGTDQVQKSMEYSYANPIIHLGGKGFLGFANQTISDNVTGFTSTTKLNADETSVYAYPAEQIVKDGTGSNISEQYLTGSKKTYASGSYFGYISQSISKDLIHNLRDTAYYYYDSYGNDTLTISRQNGVMKTTTRNQYLQQGAWCPSLVSSTTLIRSSYNGQPPYSSSSVYSYDDLGRLTNLRVFASLKDSLSTHFNYNVFGNILRKSTKTVNGEPRVENYDYDIQQRFVTSVTKGNLSGSFECSPETGSVTESTEPNGLVTTYNYDGFGRQTKQQITANKYISTSYNWNINESDTTVYFIVQSDALSNKSITWFDYSGKERKKRSTAFSGDSIFIKKQYNNKDELLNISKPYFSSSAPVWNSYYYDHLGRITSSSVNGASVGYSYNNNEITTTLQVPGANRVNTVIQNGVGQITAVERNNKSLGFEYDNKGGLSGVNPPVSGSSVNYDYDTRALLTKETDPDRGSTDYRHNSFGELTHYQNANGDVDSIIYDCLGRDSIRIRNNVNTIYIYYSSGPGKGRVSQINSPSGYKKYSYDLYGNITRQCDSIPGQVSFPFTYVYDDYGRMSEMTYPGGFTVTYHYNTNGYLESIKKKSDNSVIWQCNSMNELGNITQYFLSGGNIEVNQSFDGHGYLKEIKTSAGSVNKQWLTYFFDEKTGDLSSRRDTIRNLTEKFGYDVFDQLKWSKVTGQDSLRMNYDDIGNIEFKSDVGDYFYNSNRVHAVDSIHGSLNLNRQSIGYNHFNKPAFIASGSDSLVYTYNVLDERIRAIHYDSLGQITKSTWYAGPYEQVDSGTITKLYYYINSPDGPIALAIKNGTEAPVIYYLCKDHLGSITGIMNSAGNILEEYNYDPWGRRRNPADWLYINVPVPTYTNRGFTGHEHLDIFNLIDMNGRIYDSEIARFLSPDPIIQDPYNILNYNRYTYCLNNPLNYTDPSGYSREAILRDMERDKANAMGGTKFFNNYPDDGWQEMQETNYQGAWQYYVSSAFRNFFPNAKFNFNMTPSRKELGTWVQIKQTEFGPSQYIKGEVYTSESQVSLEYVPYIIFSNHTEGGGGNGFNNAMDNATNPFVGLGAKLVEDFGDDVFRGLGGTGKTVSKFLGPVSDIWSGYNMIKTANNPNLSNSRMAYDLAKNGIPVGIDAAIMLSLVDSNPGGWIATGIGVVMEGAQLFYDKAYVPAMNYLLDYSSRWDSWFKNGGYSNFYSDQRLKTRIVEVDTVLNKLLLLHAYNFRWKADTTFEDIGLLAQEVERVFPEMIVIDSLGYKQIAYHKLVPILLQAIKEQNDIIKQQKDTLEKYDKHLKEQDRLLNNINQRLNKIEKDK